MSKTDSLSGEGPSLKNWRAEITFGPEAVDAILSEARWAQQFPDVVERLQSRDEIAKSQTVLPGEMIYVIAGRDECTFDFYASPDGDRLYGKYRHKEWPEPRAIDVVHVLSSGVNCRVLPRPQ
jgi:hypothetical protein